MICGHGSRSASAVAEFAGLAETLRGYFPDWPLEYGYLEFAKPIIKTGLDKLRAQGVEHILAVPGCCSRRDMRKMIFPRCSIATPPNTASP